MLHTLSLKNFKQHEKFEISFTQGLNIISGENGAGKSSILKAILYALFGVSAAGRKEHLKTWGTTGEMEVKLSLRLGGKDLTITRGLEKATINEGDNLLASGQTPCTKHIEQELGIDFKTFKHLLYTAQGDTQVLLKLGASDLQKRVESITRLDSLDKIITLISKDLNRLDGILSVIPEITDLGEQRINLNQVEEELSELLLSIDKESSLKKEKSEEIDTKVRFRDNEVRPAVQKYKEVTAARVALSKALQNLETELIDHQSNKSEQSSEALGSLLKSLKDHLAVTESKLRALKKAKASLSSAAEELHEFDQLEVVYFEYNDLRIALESVTKAYEATHRDYLEAHKNPLVCSECNRPFDDPATFGFMQEKRKKLEQDVLELRGKKNELEKRINDMVKCYTVLRTYPDFIVHRDLLAAQVKEAKDSLDSLSGSIDEMAKEIETTEGVVRDTERSYTKSSKWDAQRDSLISQINRLRKEFNSLPNDLPLWYDKDLEEVETKIKQLQEQLDLLVLNLVEKKLSFQEKENDVKLRRQTLSEAVRNLGTRQETLHSIMLRKELQSYLRNNRARLMGDTWGRITDLTSGYASQVTDGLIRNLMRDDDGGFTVEEGEHKVPVNELSGGRQSVVGLALRVALGRTFFGEGSFILLDEPTSDCSENLAASVAGMLQGLGTQVIVVSHRQGDTVNATNVIIL